MTFNDRFFATFSRLAPFASRLTAIALCAMLTACGFHLRGQAALPYETMYVAGPPAFANLLGRAIRAGSNTRIIDNPKDAQVTLHIVNEQNERVILSLSGSGRVRELQLRYRVSYRLTDRENREYLPVTEVQLKRDLTYSDTDVLGKEQEEQLLNRDMRNDAVQQIVRRLQVARIDMAPAPKSAP